MSGFITGTLVTKDDDTTIAIQTVTNGLAVKTPGGGSATVTRVITTVGDPVDRITITPSSGTAFTCHPEQRVQVDGTYKKAKEILIGQDLGVSGSGIHVASLDIVKAGSTTFYSLETDQTGAGGYLVEAQPVTEPQSEYAY